jgi:GNAT superfamily N-acetyltransferase
LRDVKIDGVSDSAITLRAFRDEQDYSAMAAIHVARMAEDQLDPRSSREVDWTSLSQMSHDIAKLQNPERDVQFAQIDDGIVGYARVRSWREDSNRKVFLCLFYSMPQFRNSGVDLKLLNWAERRAKEIAGTCAVGDENILAANASDAERDTARILLDRGYKPFRFLIDMACDNLAAVSNVSLPYGIEVRALAQKDWAAVCAGFDESFAHRSAERSASNFPTVDTSLWQLAWCGDEFAGGVEVSRRSETSAQVDQVYVRPKFRRCRIGTALLRAALMRSRKHGITAARIHTDDSNPLGAKSIYERSGFLERKRYGLYRKPMT